MKREEDEEEPSTLLDAGREELGGPGPDRILYCM